MGDERPSDGGPLQELWSVLRFAPDGGGGVRSAFAGVGPWGAVTTLGAVIALTAVTWQTTSLDATNGLDASWVAALHLAHAHGVQFGANFVWTYGPLGYLAFPVAVTPSTLAQAFVFAVCSQVVLCYLLLRSVSLSVGLPLAFAAVYFLAQFPLSRPDVLFLLVFVYGMAALDHPTSWPGRSFPVAGSALAGAALLMKTSFGVTAVGLALIIVLALHETAGRRALLGIPLLVVTPLVLWVGTGNSLGDLPDWLKLSSGLVSGYSSAMQTTDQHRQLLKAAGVVAIFAVALFCHASRYSRRQRVAVIVASALFLFSYFKEGFVRQDFAHTPYFFTAAAIAFGSVPWRGATRLLAVGGVALCALAIHSTVGFGNAPEVSAPNLYHQTRTVLSSDRRASLTARSSQTERRVYRLPAKLLRQLRGHTVDVDPYETALVSAYGLAWRPLPVFQEYAAYTSALDQRNAAFLASREAPERILRQRPAFGVNGRNLELAAPATFRGILCNFEQIGVAGTWQVVARVPARCGRPRLLRIVLTSSGSTIRVPRARPEDLVLARIQVRDSLWNHLEGFLYKPKTARIKLGRHKRVELVAATAGDGIVVHIPAAVGFASRFEGTRSWQSLAVTTVTGGVRVAFYSVAVRRATGSRTAR